MRTRPFPDAVRLFVLCILLCVWAGCGDPGTGERSARRLPPAGDDARLLASVVRFRPPASDPASLPPSFALVDPFPQIDDVPEGWRVVPDFSTDGQRFTATIATAPGTSLYGTGEIAGPLLRNGAVTEAWNTSSAGYTSRNPSLYQSHPWVLAVRADGTAFGVLADTPRRTRIDLTEGIAFSTAGQGFPVVVIDADSPQGVLRRLAVLTGRMSLPALWAIGYHQCRFSYYPDSQVRAIADGFRSRDIPCDVIWVDIDYMDGYRVFTFDPAGFPDPAATNAYLHERGFHSVWILDPGVKLDPGYAVFDQGTAGDHWVLTAEGVPYVGIVWPGLCVFPDYTRPETRAWWAGLYRDFMATGVDGVWNDMNEPEVFPPPPLGAGTMPEDNLHRGGGALPPGPHALYHNVYGMLMVRATREGVLAANPQRRPFILSRANYIGGQRYAAAWTGDNTANWENLYWSVPMILNLGLSGQPFSGPDIGGHLFNATGELFARWMGVGAFFPFSRGHKTKTFTRPHEPWSFGPEVEAAARTALERRYRLLPYLYTVFREAAETGLPVMRPVFFADPAYPGLREEDHAFLIGADLLVEPDLLRRGSHDFALPGGIWRPFTLVGEDPSSDVNQPRLRIRGGSILPVGRKVQSTAETLLDPLTLVVCLDGEGRAAGRLYEDAGDGFDYRDGAYLLTTYVARRVGDTVRVRIASTEGAMARPERAAEVWLVTEAGVIQGRGSEARGIEIVVP